MLRFALLLVVFTLTQMCEASGPIDKCRDLYFSESKLKELSVVIAEIENVLEATPILKAYQGSFIARAAGFGYNPYSKWTKFNSGRALIESAVDEDSENPEIRFLRLSVQHAAPSFLGYSSNIDMDLSHILDALTRGWLIDQEKLRTHIISYLEMHHLISPPQSNQLRLAQQRL